MASRQPRIPDEEQTLLNGILEYAQYKHVLAMHPRPARTQDGWRTAIQGDKGFFDITLIGPGGIILAELKRRKGAEHTVEQKAWAEMARAAGLHFDPKRFVVALWTFDNWPHDITPAIDVIAKPSPSAAQIATGEGIAVRDESGAVVAERLDLKQPLPERPAVAPPTPPVASGAGAPIGVPIPVQVHINDDSPGMRMAAGVRAEVLRLRRARRERA